MTDLELMQLAEEARKFSYCPYSHFAVGAALLTCNGKVYTGCNVENAGYTATNCAERTAVFKAISEGESRFAAIAVIGAPEGEAGKFCAPCGVCRQVLREFCEPETFRVLLGTTKGVQVYTLAQLLPTSFGPSDLKGE
jgi:cytidine deaminase